MCYIDHKVNTMSSSSAAAEKSKRVIKKMNAKTTEAFSSINVAGHEIYSAPTKVTKKTNFSYCQFIIENVGDVRDLRLDANESIVPNGAKVSFAKLGTVMRVSFQNGVYTAKVVSAKNIKTEVYVTDINSAEGNNVKFSIACIRAHFNFESMYKDELGLETGHADLVKSEFNPKYSSPFVTDEFLHAAKILEVNEMTTNRHELIQRLTPDRFEKLSSAWKDQTNVVALEWVVGRGMVKTRVKGDGKPESVAAPSDSKRVKPSMDEDEAVQALLSIGEKKYTSDDEDEDEGDTFPMPTTVVHLAASKSSSTRGFEGTCYVDTLIYAMRF